MVSTIATNILFTLCLLCLLLPTPAAAFGSGFVNSNSQLAGFVARHGDIGSILVTLPITYIGGGNAIFGSKNAKRVYFGNWLRDFSQIIDTGALSQVPEKLLLIIVALFGLMEFGYATREFEIKREDIGVYRPEEHVGKLSYMEPIFDYLASRSVRK
jgi:hypothetical protein